MTKNEHTYISRVTWLALLMSSFIFLGSGFANGLRSNLEDDFAAVTTDPCDNNLLHNAGFEGGLTGWTFASGAKLTSHPVNSGHSALRLDFPGSYAYQSRTIAEGDSWNVSYYAKDHSTSTKSRSEIQYKDANGHLISQVETSFSGSGYQLFNFSGVAPPNTAKVFVVFYRPHTGTNNEAWVDDVCFTINPNNPVGPVNCSPQLLVSYDFSNCNSCSSGSNVDWSELTPTVSGLGGFDQVLASNARPSHPGSSHSCTPGAQGNSMCIGQGTSIEFEITLTDTASNKLSGISFFEQAPNQYLWETAGCGTGSNSGTNNPPLHFQLEVYKGGYEIFDQNYSTQRSWNLRELDFSANSAFTFAGTETFTFKFTPLNASSTGGSVKAWDIDELKVFGCSTQETSITFQQGQDVVEAAAPGALDAIATFVAPTATTDCPDGGLSIVQTAGLASGSAFPVGTTTIEFTATDSCGNQEITSLTVTIEATPSQITLQPGIDVTQPAAPGVPAATVDFLAPIATTDCALGGLIVAQTGGLTSGSLFPIGSSTIEFTATDSCGNSEVTTLIVTVEATPATLTLQPGVDVTVTAAPNATDAIVTFDTPTATTDCPTGTATVTQTAGLASGSAFPIGTSTVEFTATDDCGNTEITTLTVTVEAPAPTEITLQPVADVTETAAPNATDAVVTFPTPTATTTCPLGGLVVTQTAGLASGSAFPIGMSTVEFTATDDCGNTEITTLTVTVEAPAPTEITLQPVADVTETAAPNATDAVVTFPTPTATTTCPLGGLVVTQTAGLASGSAFPIGTSTIEFTATDDCGNTEVTTLTVTVLPGGNPPTYVVCIGLQPWFEWIEQVQFADLDNSSAKEGYKFFDQVAPANVTTGSTETITVTPGLSWPGYQSNLFYTAFIDFNQDGDFEDAGEEILRDNATSAGVTASVQIPTDALTGITRMRVVMQRDAYVEATGGTFDFGEVEDYLVSITPGVDNGTITLDALADQMIEIAPGETTAPVTFNAPDATTTCPTGGLVVTQTAGPASGSTLAAGTYTIEFTATDDCGNTETTAAQISVVDPNTGLITLQPIADVSVTAAPNATDAIVTFPTPAATTTCPLGGLVVTQTAGLASGSAFPIGTSTIEFTATDDCGNTEVTSFTVTVEAPLQTEITLQPGISVTETAAPGATDAIATFLTPTATTTCPLGGLVVTQTAGLASGSAFPIGTSTIEFTATDDCGNIETTTLAVTILPGGNTPTYVVCIGLQPWFEWIEQVQFADLDNSSAKEGYKFFDQVAPANVTTGSTETITVTPGLSWSGYQANLFYTAFIDFNQDGDFEDAGEEILRDNATSAGVTASVQIPTDALTGITRMRVVMQRDAYVEATGGTFDFGEVEDYLVSITPGVNNGTITLDALADQMIEIAPGETTALVTFNAPNATTTCPTGGLVVTQTAGPASGSALAAGTYTIEFTATDDCGNTETTVAQISVVDPNTGMITLQPIADVSVTAAPNATDAIVTFPTPTATTTCPLGGLVVTQTAGLASGSAFPIGTSTVEFTATDDCGNTEVTTITITVNPDPTAGGACTGTGPSYPCNGVNVGGWEPWFEWISRVEFANIDNTSAKEAYAFFDQVAPAGVTAGGSETLTVTPGLSWPGYITSLYYTAYIDFNQDGDFDDAGEEILRENTTSAGVTTPVQIPANATSGITRLRVVMQRDAYAGACESFSFGSMEDYLVCIGGGSTNNGILTLNGPADQNVTIAQGQTTIVVNFPDATATTTCPQGGLVVNQTAGPASGDALTAGTYTVVFEATDACGNAQTVTSTITVNAPTNNGVLTLNGPADQNVTIAQGQTTIVVNFPDATATTTCPQGGLVVTQTAGPASGSALTAGTYTVVFEATDACGNAQTVTSTITVNAPANNGVLTLTVPADQTITLANGETTTTVTFVDAVATTTCPQGGLIAFQLSGITSGQVVSEGIYNLTFRAFDACGNEEIGTTTITVIPANNGVLTLNGPADQIVDIAPGETTAVVMFPDAIGNTTCPAGGLVVTQTAGPASGTALTAGTYVVEFTATDACGNSETVTSTITVNPANNGVLTLVGPADQNVDIAPGQTTAVVNFPDAIASTTCPAGGLVVNQTAGPASGTALAAGTYTVVFEATDACGNSETVTSTITVNPANNGVLTLNGPADQNVDIAPGQTTAVVNFPDAIASTTCPVGGLNVVQTAGPASGTALTAGTYVVEFTATDACGNNETVTSTITVNPADNGVLTLNGPADQIVDIAPGETTAVVMFPDAIGNTTCPAGGLNVVQTAGPASGTALAAGTYTVVFTATDACGNSETVTSTITVNPADNGVLTLNGPADQIVDIAPGETTAVVMFPDAIGNTTCPAGGLNVVQTAGPASGTALAAGTYTVVFTATDACGNSETVTSTITVNPANNGVLTLNGPADQIVDIAPGETTAVVMFPDAIGSTTCPAGGLNVVQTAGPASGTALAAGTYTVVFEALDACGNAETTSFDITVNAPNNGNLNVNCTPTRTVQILPGQTSVVLGYNIPTGFTTCPLGGVVATRVSGPAPNSTRRAGTYNIVYNVTDACGNAETCNFTVTVLAPNNGNLNVNCTQDRTVQIPAGQTTIALGYNAPTANTSCSLGGLSVTRTNGPAPSDRRSAGNYAISYRITDACGNVETCNFTVTVLAPNNGNLNVNCPQNSSVEIQRGQTSAVLGYNIPTGFTTCPLGGVVATRVSGPAPNESRGAGTYNIVYNVTDACGNAETCNFIVTVLAPNNGNLNVNCTQDRTVQIPAGQTAVALGYNAPTASTTCPLGGVNVSRVSGPAPSAIRQAGTYFITYNVTDACGNAETCNFRVTVLAPNNGNINLNCPANSSVQIAQGQTSAVLGYTIPTANTSCSIGGVNVTRTNGPAPSESRTAGTYTITYRATDACGNTQDCNFTVTVLAAPVGAPVCANRVVTDNRLCVNTAIDYSFFGNIVQNVSGDGSYYQMVGGSFVEFTDGTARLTGQIINNHRSDVRFDVNVEFSARTQSAPVNSPKGPLCGSQNPTSDYYYYPVANGTLVGRGILDGGQISITRAGPSFQIGTGANQNEKTRLGASGWFNIQVVSHPTSSASFDASEVVDFNINLSGAANECVTPPANPSPCANNLLANPGFESGQNHWDFLQGAAVTSHPVNSGSKALYLDHPGSYAYQTFNASAGDDWSLRFFAKDHSSATNSASAIQYLDAYHHKISDEITRFETGSYKEFNASGTAPAGTHKIVVMFYRPNSGTNNEAWVDDVCFSINNGSYGRVASPINLYAQPTQEGVELNWITELAPDENMFELQRENKFGEWEVIATVNAPAQTAGAESFDYVDENPTIGTNNYRVLVVSPLEVRESQVRSVDYLSADAVTAFPNPASDQLFVSLKGFSGFDVDITMYNALGQEMTRVEVIGADDNPILIPTGNFQSGIYTVYAVAGGARKAMRVKVINE